MLSLSNKYLNPLPLLYFIDTFHIKNNGASFPIQAIVLLRGIAASFVIDLDWYQHLQRITSLNKHYIY